MDGNISLPNVGNDYSNFYGRFLDVPHLLIAGTTGSGKSVFVNGLIHTAMQTRFPFAKIARGCNFIFIDAKRTELSIWEQSPHCIYYACEDKDIITALNIAIAVCNRRGKALEERNKENFAKKIWERKYFGGDLYIVIDEFADLMENAEISKDVVRLVQKIAQIGRSQKVHLWLCTQTPKADVIPTKITCNFDNRIGLRVTSAQQSRLIIGDKGLESFNEPYGNCIYSSPKGLEKISGIPLVSDYEQIELVQYWMQQVPELDLNQCV